MAHTDPIADMLTRIRNACKAKRTFVDVPASRLKRDLARILIEEQYIRDMVEVEDPRQGVLRLYLRYNRNDEPVISGLDRISKPGLRRYIAADLAIRTGRRKMGITIISTSSGVMTHRDAHRKGVGGELICRVW